MADFLERIAEAEARSRDLETQLSDPNVGKEPRAIEKLGRRLGALRPLLEVGGKPTPVKVLFSFKRQRRGDPG